MEFGLDRVVKIVIGTRELLRDNLITIRVLMSFVEGGDDAVEVSHLVVADAVPERDGLVFRNVRWFCFTTISSFRGTRVSAAGDKGERT